jgi:SAM-dependent methyltransferase
MRTTGNPLARLRDRVQVGARDDVADGERDRLGAEHDGGGAYPATRRTEPRIAAQVWAAPCVAAAAENLPFADQSFDAAMAFSSVHHWQDPVAGLREMRRVARRVVVFTYDASEFAWRRRFWLTRDYLPEAGVLAADWSLAGLADAIGARTEPVLIPWDCADGFFEAYWRRLGAYLEEQVRRACSVWTKVGAEAEHERCTVCGRTLTRAGGPSATRNSPTSTLRNSASACLWPDSSV